MVTESRLDRRGGETRAGPSTSAPLRFSENDLRQFSAASHDANPIHLDPAYARRTACGQRVVFGVLAVLRCLQRLAPGAERPLRRLEADFSNPVFVDVDYQMRVRESRPDRMVVQLCEGELVLVELRAWLSEPRAGSSLPTSAGTSLAPERPALRDVPRDYDEAQLAAGPMVGGSYAAASDATWFVEQDASAVTPLQAGVLMLCSYLVGMELPGLRSVLFKLRLDFDSGTGAGAAHLQYEARTRHYEPTYGLSEMDLRVRSTHGPVASGTVSAFVRKRLGKPDLSKVLAQVKAPRGCLTGKVALVTGGSRGLGAAIVQALALQGSDVILNFCCSRTEAQALHAQLQAAPGRVVLHQGDAASPTWCNQTREWLLERYGGLDFLVCNACAPPLAFGESGSGRVRGQRYVEENLALMTVPMRAFLDLLEARHGALVAISSSIVASDTQQWPQYKQMKGAVEAAVQAASESRREVSFLVLRPPALLTEMSNTPTRSVGALAPEVVAARLADALAAEAPPGRVELVTDFSDDQPRAGGVEGAAPAPHSVERIAVAATFTAKPLLSVIDFWSAELGWSIAPELAPYNQLYQELLDPQSLLCRNRGGLNVVLLRFGDWLRERPQTVFAAGETFLGRVLDDLIDALTQYCRRPHCHTLLLVCPESAAYADSPPWEELTRRLGQALVAAANELSGLDAVWAADYHARYQITADILDPVSEQLAHVPFTPPYYAFLGTLIARRFHALHTKPCKVIAVDCDNTLWRGVCGEVGASGVIVDDAARALQQFLVEQKRQGVLLCLCSKNNAADVQRVFEVRSDMRLSRGDFVDSRINWRPKSDNLRSLAADLKLGLDSFVFLDDSPLECAEVETACPQVLTLQVPSDLAELRRVLHHTWIFDHFEATEEDGKRTDLYLAERQRRQLQTASGDFRIFIASLELEVDIQPAARGDVPRIAQLTQRTNQFNFTTIRCTESKFETWLERQPGGHEPGYECQVVRVRDRFGEYGLVGLIVFTGEGDALAVDSFMLSCRVLGRGVEHRMMAALGALARARSIDTVRVLFRETPSNRPAKLFLDQLVNSAGGRADGDSAWSFAADRLAQVKYEPQPPQEDSSEATASQSTAMDPDPQPHSAISSWRRIAADLSDLQVLAAQVRRRGSTRAASSDSLQPRAMWIDNERDVPREALLASLKALFAETLALERDAVDVDAQLETYVRDSLDNVTLTVALKKRYPDIPITILFEHRSISSIAAYLLREHAGSVTSRHPAPAMSVPDVRLPPQPGSEREECRLPDARQVVHRSPDNGAIAIIGINGRFPKAATVFEFWENLVAGRSCISEVPQDRWEVDAFFAPARKGDSSYCKRGGFIDDVDRFDAGFFRIAPREAELMDPQQRLFLEVVWGLVEDAGYTRETIGRETGVFVASNASDYGLYANSLALQGVSAYRNADAFQIPNRISYFFDFRGPSLCLDTACSGSGTAVYLACQSLRNAQCRAAIAGGINLFLHPSRFIQYSQMQMLSPSGRCSPFGANADGTVFGEGVGALLLKPLAAAQRDGDHIYAVIKGCAINSGGKTTGFTVPNPQAHAALVSAALHDAHIDPATITYVEAHGTGTPLGDPIEIRGLSLAFEQNYGAFEQDGGPSSQGSAREQAGAQFCAIGSVKGNIGHLEAGAAIPGLVKIIMQMNRGILVPSLNAADLNPSIPFAQSPFRVQRQVQAWERPSRVQGGSVTTYPRRAGISSFGAGGSNAHIILEEYVGEATAGTGEARPTLVLLSARKREALKAGATGLVTFLRHSLQRSGESGAGTFPRLADIAFTLRVGREQMEERLALVVASVAELIDALSSWAARAEEVAAEEAPIDSSAVVAAQAGTHGTQAPLDPRVRGDDIDRRFPGAESPGHVYWGKAGAQQPNPESPNATERQALVAALIEQRNWPELARLWIRGISPDWALLPPLEEQGSVGADVPRRISLPTYAFAGDRFWLPGEPNLNLARLRDGQARDALASGVHPLLDGIEPTLSLGPGIVFTKRLAAHEPVVHDHIVRGQALLPGVGFLEMACAALKRTGTPGPYRLSEVIWSHPLAIKREPREILISLTARESGELRFEVRSRDLTAGIAHASGAVGRHERGGELEPAAAAIDVIIGRCSQVLDHEAVYSRCHALGIDYGPYFRSIERMHRNEDEALSIVRLPASAQGEIEQYILHPSILDAGLQTALILTQGDATAVPFSAEAVDVLRPLGPVAYAHARRIAPQRFEVSLLDESGAVCVRFSDLCLRPLRDPLERFFYAPRWKQSPLPMRAGAAEEKTAHVLIVHSAQSAALAEALAALHTGTAVDRVLLDARSEWLDEDRWQTATAEPQAPVNRFAVQGNVERIYFLGGIRRLPADIDNLSALERSQELGVRSLFRLLKALIRQGLTERPLDLFIIVNDVFGVLPKARTQPHAASLLGLGKVIAKEFPRLQVRCLDISLAGVPPAASLREWQALLGPVLAEPALRGGEVVIRGGQRYVQILEPIRVPSVLEPPYRTAGVYLILGGAGGLGFELSLHLAETVQARLVWLGRSPLDADKREKIARIEARGGEVLYLQADATDAVRMREAVQRAKHRFGAIHGAVHSAIVLRDRTLANMSEHEFDAALAPKVVGSAVLYQVLKEEPLDFLLFFSSASAYMAPMGQANYVAGCCFKDALGRHLNEIARFPSKVINWGYWGTTGVASSESYEQWLTAQGYRSIHPKEGMDAIGRILTAPLEEVVAVKAQDDALARMGVALATQARPRAPEIPPLLPERERYSSKEIRDPPAGAPADGNRDDRRTVEPVAPASDLGENQPAAATATPEQHAGDENLRPATLSYIKKVFAEITKTNFSDLDSQSTFDRYGVDSLMGLAITQRFEKDLGNLPATMLFQYPTIDALAAWFLEEHRGSLIERCGVEPARTTRPSAPAERIPATKAASEPTRAASQESPQGKLEEVVGATPRTVESEPIAIIGVAGRYPQADTLEELWDNLAAGRDCVTEIPLARWDTQAHYAADADGSERSHSKWGGFISDVDKFDALFFHLSPKEAQRLDPQERLFLETAWHTFEAAGYTRRRLGEMQKRQAAGIGVFVGCMYQQYPWLAPDQNTGVLLSTASYWSIANRVSYFFNLSGPSLAVDSACSSSLTAIHLACASLKSGECAMALAGGVNLNLHPSKYLRLQQLGMLASSAQSKSLGDGDGLVPAEGVGAVLLKPLSAAIQDGDIIHAVIKSSIVNHGGRTSGFTVPNPNAQAELIAGSLQKAGIDPRTINYVEVAANGSALGDPIEIAGLTAAFRHFTSERQFCAIGSVKSNLGHLEAASGIAQLTKVLLQLRHAWLVPSLNAEPLNPNLRLESTPFYVQQRAGPWQRVRAADQDEPVETPRRAAISSFGAGGSNAHVLMEEYQGSAVEPAGTPSIAPQLVVLSARTEESLKRYAASLVEFLQGKSGMTVPSEVAAKPLEDLRHELASAAAEILQVARDDIDLESNLGDYGFDATHYTALARRLSDRYSIEISFRTLSDARSLEGLAQHLWSHYQQAVEAQRGEPAPVFAPTLGLASLTNIAYTLQVGREPMRERLAVVVSSKDELATKLDAYCRGTEAAENLQRGRALAATANLIVDDVEGKEYLDSVIRNRKLNKLAQLWTNGVAIEWELLHTGAGDLPRRVALPTYQFDKRRYWIADDMPSARKQPIETLTSNAGARPERSDRRQAPEPVEPIGTIPDAARDPEHAKAVVPETLKRDIALLVADLLAVDEAEIDYEEELRAYGFDSISLTTLAQRIGAKLDLDIAASVFLAYPSVAACADDLWASNQDKLCQHYRGSAERASIVVEQGEPRRARDPGAAPVSRSGAQARESAAQTDSSIAIVGIGGRMPQSSSMEQFWEHLIAGKELITEIPKNRWDWQQHYGDPHGSGNKTRVKWGGFLRDVDQFDSLFFGISPREAESMDPRQRLLLETVWSTIENAGYAPDAFAGTDTGLFVGVGNNDYGEVLRAAKAELTAHASTGLMVNSILTSRVSYLLDLRGPSEILDTACSSSTVALHRAIRAIRSGECHAAIAGGVNLLLDPQGFVILDKAGLLSADGKVRLFSEGAGGYVRGEGVGAVLLKPLQQARTDRDHIYAVIRGSAVNHDGRSYSLTAPNPRAQAEVVLRAYREAAVDPASVSYIEAQGAGSPLADPVEIDAFKTAFKTLYREWGIVNGGRACGIGYLKPNIGHLECASGIAALLKLVWALQTGEIPAARNVDEQAAQRRLGDSPFYIVSSNQRWEPKSGRDGRSAPRRAGLHSFGLGGVNAHVVLEEYPRYPERRA